MAYWRSGELAVMSYSFQSCTMCNCICSLSILFLTMNSSLQIPLVPNGTINRVKKLSHPGHDWANRPLIDGPQDSGFDWSYISTSGVQSSPYTFFRDGFLTTQVSEVFNWEKGVYPMPRGASVIKRRGEGDPEWDQTAYNMIVVNETASFIDNHFLTRPDAPFFAYAALGAVHGPHSPPDHYLDGSAVAGMYETAHMDMLLEMDKSVGSLVAMIEDRGIANETIIIFASDNGGVKMGKGSAEYGHDSHGPLRGAKGEVYEGGHRVPMVFRYDGVFPANETRSQLVGLNDIYSTLCELAEVDVPLNSAQDSNSFANYIMSENNQEGLSQFMGTWAYTGGHVSSEAMRFGNMKLIRHEDITAELYDLSTDLSESNNLITNSTYDEVKKEMLQQLRRVGPCPPDREGRFIMTTGKKAGKKKNCKWFKKNLRRCKAHIIDGELYCNSVCGGRHKWACKI